MQGSPQQPGDPPPGAAPHDPGGSPRGPSAAPAGPAPPQGAAADVQAEISAHVGAIVATLEREIEARREEARREADRLIADALARADELLAERQARIAALSDELLRKSEAIAARLSDPEPARRGFEHLIRALADTSERLARLGTETAERGSGSDPHPSEPRDEAGSRGAEAVPAPQIVASEMANAGASRASVHAYLSAALGVTRPEPFLDHAFGREAG